MVKQHRNYDVNPFASMDMLGYPNIVLLNQCYGHDKLSVFCVGGPKRTH